MNPQQRTATVRSGTLAMLSLLLPLLGQAQPGRDTSWPDTPAARQLARASIESLHETLLASRSATSVLQDWCASHRLAAHPKIEAWAYPPYDKPPTSAQRQRLAVGETEPVRYRRVQLRCGARVLSEAETWYVPSRLSAEQLRLLDHTETPFGVVVRPLEPYRVTFEAELLWRPAAVAGDPETPAARTDAGLANDASPPTCGSRHAATLSLPGALIEHRAVLHAKDQRPIAEVHEVYQRALLDFPPPESSSPACR